MHELLVLLFSKGIWWFECYFFEQLFFSPSMKSVFILRHSFIKQSIVAADGQFETDL